MLEEKQKAEILKPFSYPEIKTGDVVKFHYLHSISEGGGNEYTGIVLNV